MFYNREPPQERERHKNHRFRLATLPVYHAFEPPSKLISIQKGYRPMDFMSSVSWGGAFNSVWGKIGVKMTETVIVNTNKHKMLCTTPGHPNLQQN